MADLYDFQFDISFKLIELLTIFKAPNISAKLDSPRKSEDSNCGLTVNVLLGEKKKKKKR